MSLSRSTPKRSPPSAHRPPPLFIPDSPLRRLSKLTLEQVAELTAHTSNSSADTEDIGGRWSIPIFLAGDVSSAGRVGASPQLDGDTPRQLLFPPTSCGDEDETVGLLSSQVLDTCTPRRLSGTGPRTPVAGRSPVVDRKVSAGSTDTDEETWSPPSPSDLVYQSANTRDILADGTVFARRNRHARGPQDSIWRHCSPLKSTSDPDPSVAAERTLFDPGYSLVAQSSANLTPRGASPFDLSEYEGQRLMPRGLQPRCPSPLDSTFMAVLSRPPFNAERASFTSKMAAQAAQKGELRLVVWMGAWTPSMVLPNPHLTHAPLSATRGRQWSNLQWSFALSSVHSTSDGSLFRTCRSRRPRELGRPLRIHWLRRVCRTCGI